jgi:hypothetical protein
MAAEPRSTVWEDAMNLRISGVLAITLVLMAASVAPWGAGAASAQTLTTLVSFDGSNGDGPINRAALIFDASGNLFGTTPSGGAYGGGTVFEITTDSTTATGYASTPTVLYSFCAVSNCTDGLDPFAGLIADASGNLFGTTYEGGASTNCTGGCGTVFEIKTDSTTTTGYATTPTTLVCFNGTDGNEPLSGLIADAHGNLFGTTAGGGGSTNCPFNSFGCGTVFEITGSGFVTGMPVVLPPSEVAATASGLAYSHVSHTFNGTVTITNISSSAISGPFSILLTSLTAGVTLANSTGSFAGSPYLTVPAVASLAAGQTATVTVQFNDPSFGTINFTPVIYSGSI